MASDATIRDVMVTGGTGFVGRYVVRELLRRGLTPICLVRSPASLLAQHPGINPDRLVPIVGRLRDRDALQKAADLSQAAIHLAGIIIQRYLRGRTFAGIHVEGTRRVVESLARARVRRVVHMSALGVRPEAASAYHRTKWSAEHWIRESGLDWTIFRPGIIHGPEGEFMRLTRRLVCGLVPPVIPCFGDGFAMVQPVSVKDVAFCVVESLRRPECIGEAYSLGGPDRYSWIELFEACRRRMPGARSWKRTVSIPAPVAKTIARISAPVMAVTELVVPPIGLYRFDAGQVSMSQEDAICDPHVAEQTFGITMRSFEDELATYADRIR